MPDPSPTDPPASPLKCPVCGEGFENEQGKGGHLASLKDAAHVAYRTLGTLPGQPSPESLAQPLGQSSSEPAHPEPEPYPEPLASASSQQEGQDAEGSEVTFAAASSIQPLRPEGSTPLLPLAPGLDKPTVPLAPIIAGTVSMAVNTVFLNRPVDEKVSAERVGETGFPLAVERMVREKFPDLPLDHPAAALLLSGANLAMLVASCRGKLEPKQEPERAPSQAEAEPSPEPSPAPRAVPSGSTGDPYWDAILAKAGGVAT